MRFREKAFLILLIVFIGIFNVGMFLVLHFTYEEELSSVKSRAIGEAYFIRTSMAEDLTNLEESMNLTFDTREKLFHTYASYYEKNQIYLELWNGTSIEQSNVPAFEAERKEVNLITGVQNVLIRTIEGEKYLFVASNLPSPYEKYSLVYAYNICDLTHNHNNLIRLLIHVDIGIMITLAVVLYLVLYHLMKPLSLLSNATQRISQGDYEVKINLKGKDEFAQLGSKFNQMAEQLNENMRELKNEAEQKQRLIDNMAHELRTPLTSINGYADYLKMAQVDEDERIHALEYIASESRRLERLSKAILYMAEVREDGLQGVTKHKICDIVENLKALFHTYNVLVEYEVHADTICGNEEMIISLLSNLIENAIRASKESGKVYVHFLQKEQLEIQVVDEGIGMSLEEVALIEEPFYRVDKARSRKSGGVGLGVSLCRQIVMAHGATMTYDSKKGKGTTVTLL